ncbi:sulfatase-like hydrolase/transferase [Ottowia sp.]|uniref:sulfatase family protein n=1 Tax=Ottowia sp. TaxID=1898956 RepID=UPI002B5B71A8|nr:sulfatase-like hydrolase/transferase [Ottowia sp.]MCP5256953.1 sulfatase-like hydrolase/transferase [Burkholderiaceae bacterium]HPR43209.1 sulfatase-like hydrolase/transferase [Ottowia sp.]HRW71604.1 sulfatase-like hydrolase/transferase [Ottowia sp.]
MTTKNRPNFIFIVADDLGYADLGCYGGRDAVFGPVSPVLDRLAQDGLLFTQGYSNSPVCSPTRFGLMTARYQYRLRGAAEEPINSRSRGSTTLGLPPEHPTLPSLLKGAGYRTALIGKWHLGYPPTFGPLRSGYEEFFGPMSGGVDYFSHCDSAGRHDLWFGEEELADEGYLTDLLSRRAVDWVDRMAAGDAPFMLSLHYTAPHWPWETREDAGRAPAIKDNLFDLAGGNIHVYRRMIHHMDEGIGWIVEALRRNGQLDNTLIVFTSDNGGERFSDNWPLVGGKMDLTEGGIRVPWIAHWPAVIRPGGQSRQLCMSMDWSATMLDAAGVAAHPDFPLDGVSMLPVLRDAAHSFDRPLHWRMNHRGQRALRQGNWKYLRVDGNDYLFDIPADERERANQAKKQPERLAAMRQAWEDWNASMPPIPEDATVSLGYSYKDMPQR